MQAALCCQPRKAKHPRKESRRSFVTHWHQRRQNLYRKSIQKLESGQIIFVKFRKGFWWIVSWRYRNICLQKYEKEDNLSLSHLSLPQLTILKNYFGVIENNSPQKYENEDNLPNSRPLTMYLDFPSQNTDTSKWNREC